MQSNLDINQWLAGLDLAQYAEAFRSNEVDEAVLKDLTAATLRARASNLSGTIAPEASTSAKIASFGCHLW